MGVYSQSPMGRSVAIIGTELRILRDESVANDPLNHADGLVSIRWGDPVEEGGGRGRAVGFGRGEIVGRSTARSWAKRRESWLPVSGETCRV